MTDDVLNVGWSLPATWVNLSLDESAEADEVADQVDARIQLDPDLAPARQALMDLYLGWARSARALQARAAAMRWDEDPVFGVAMATLLLFRLERDVALPDLASRLATMLPNDQRPPHVEAVRLPVGDAVRLDAVRDPTEPGREPQPVRFVLQYWITPDDAPEDLLQLEATTANLAVGPTIVAEVDSIAESMAIG